MPIYNRTPQKHVKLGYVQQKSGQKIHLAYRERGKAKTACGRTVTDEWQVMDDNDNPCLQCLFHTGNVPGDERDLYNPIAEDF